MVVVAGSLMSTLERALSMGLPARLQIAGSGSVHVYPREGRYVTDIQDWAPVYAADGAAIEFAPGLWNTPPANAQPLEVLRWRAAYQSALRDEAEGQSLERELFTLVSWPSMTRVPPELLASLARICALLWRKPTVGYLVARVLGLPAGHAAVLLRSLLVMGYVQTARTVSRAAQAATGNAPAYQAETLVLESAFEASTLESLPASDASGFDAEMRRRTGTLLARLWKRLTQTSEA